MFTTSIIPDSIKAELVTLTTILKTIAPITLEIVAIICLLGIVVIMCVWGYREKNED